jgi:hypothetical protein
MSRVAETSDSPIWKRKDLPLDQQNAVAFARQLPDADAAGPTAADHDDIVIFPCHDRRS